MLLMDPRLDGNDPSENMFDVSDIDYINFSVQWTTPGGTVQIQYSPDNGTNWYNLDETNLAFTAAGQKVAVWGQCLVRAKGTSVTGTPLPAIYIGRRYVHPIES